MVLWEVVQGDWAELRKSTTNKCQVAWRLENKSILSTWRGWGWVDRVRRRFHLEKNSIWKGSEMRVSLEVSMTGIPRSEQGGVGTVEGELDRHQPEPEAPLAWTSLS